MVSWEGNIYVLMKSARRLAYEISGRKRDGEEAVP